jgi:exodeoxyribonuclease-3
MTHLLHHVPLVDSYRKTKPNEVGYSWWSYRGGAREKNVGWRLDYMLVSERLMPRLDQSVIHADIHGSDHCPVSIQLQL